jgi:hypothetical protein
MSVLPSLGKQFTHDSSGGPRTAHEASRADPEPDSAPPVSLSRLPLFRAPTEKLRLASAITGL